MRLLKFLFVVALVGAGAYAWYFYLPFGPAAETFVDIAPGTGISGIARQLEKAGVIRSRYAFEAMKEVHGGRLLAGEYRFDHAAPIAEIYARIRKGDVFTRTLVIPEGFNIFDISNAVQAAGLGSAVAFLQAERQHTELVKLWEPGATSVEGYLFPDTYKFSPHATPLQILQAMVKRFREVSARLGLTGQDVGRTVTVASLVEKEVHIDTERPLVAGVFENRMADNMPLQTDPAVAYASQLRGTWTGVIHQSELHSDSAYNTYTHAGLPPGPICNPGVAALIAALKPARTDYLYFVADAQGATKFSRDLKEHEEQVAAFRAASR